MKSKLAWLCPSNITAVISTIRATQPGGGDEIGTGPAVSDSKAYAIYQRLDVLNAPPPSVPVMTDMVQILCYFQTPVLCVILRKKNKQR